jgi:hypothetical protein
MIAENDEDDSEDKEDSDQFAVYPVGLWESGIS